MRTQAMTLAVGFLAGTGVGAALAGAPADPAAARTPRVAVVVYAGPPDGARRAAAAKAGARAAGVTCRTPRTLPEQVSVTSRLAVEDYTAIVGVGLDRRRAIRPLNGRVRYIPVGPRGPELASQVEAVARRAKTYAD